MSEEENKAITLLNELLLERNENKIVINTFDLFGNIEIVLKLIERQQKEFEDLREVIEKYYIDKDKISKVINKSILELEKEKEYRYTGDVEDEQELLREVLKEIVKE